MTFSRPVPSVWPVKKVIASKRVAASGWRAVAAGAARSSGIRANGARERRIIGQRAGSALVAGGSVGAGELNEVPQVAVEIGEHRDRP